MRIFVYGSLKRGFHNHRHLEWQRFLGTAKTQPVYRLVSFESYPGIVHDRNGVAVNGEVWEVDDDAKARLDLLEWSYSCEVAKLETDFFGTVMVYVTKAEYLVYAEPYNGSSWEFDYSKE